MHELGNVRCLSVWSNFILHVYKVYQSLPCVKSRKLQCVLNMSEMYKCLTAITRELLQSLCYFKLNVRVFNLFLPRKPGTAKDWLICRTKFDLYLSTVIFLQNVQVPFFIKNLSDCFQMYFFSSCFNMNFGKCFLGVSDIAWNHSTHYIVTLTEWQTSTIGIILPLGAWPSHHGILLDSLEGNEHNCHVE